MRLENKNQTAVTRFRYINQVRFYTRLQSMTLNHGPLNTKYGSHLGRGRGTMTVKAATLKLIHLTCNEGKRS